MVSVPLLVYVSAFSIVSLIAFEMWQVTEIWIASLHEQFL